MNHDARYVTLDELDFAGRVVRMSAEDASALVRTELVEARPEGGDRWRLVPRGRVGAVRVGDLQVQVTPKDRVGVRHLLFLLGYATSPGFRPDDVDGVAHDELWPALAESLARQVERALTHGVLQGYRTVEDALRTVRGRIRIGDQLTRRPGLLVPIEVTYDEFTVDTAENRILRTALRRMLTVPGLEVGARRRLAHLDARLEGVTVMAQGTPLPFWNPSRLNARYQPALRLAEIVLRHGSVETAGKDGVTIAAFVVSMWEVFENFVTAALREALRPRPGRTEAQHRTYLDVPPAGRLIGDIRMDVDIVHFDAMDRPCVVYDAKYKSASASGLYPNADHYQMLAYCTALKVPVAWLVYAEGAAAPRRRPVRNTGVTVVEFPLDLAQDPRTLLRSVELLAEMSTPAISRTLPA